MTIETLQDWNTRLGYCGCCPMPECPVPLMLCQSRRAESTKWLYPPFEKPVGKPSDPVPAMYQAREIGWPRTWDTGTAIHYEGWRLNPTVSNNWQEHLQVQSLDGSFAVPGAWSSVEIGNHTLNDTGDHADPMPWTPIILSGSDGFNYFDLLYGGGRLHPWSADLSDTSTVVSAGKITITPDSYVQSDDSIRYTKGTIVPSLQGAGGIDNQLIRYWDVTTHGEFRVNFQMPLTLATWRGILIENLVPWPEGNAAPEGVDCEAAFVSDWPTIAEVDWMDEQSVWNIADRKVISKIIGTRFRWKLQSLIEYGPDGEDEDTQPDILDWWRGTAFKITWDVLEEPDGWDRMIDDPDYQAPDEEPEGGWPPVPQIPDPDRPQRSFYLKDQTWTWSGPGDPEDEDSWMSDWYEIPPPELPGTRRVVNIRFICQPNNPYGCKPQVIGEAVELPDP